MRPRVHPHRSSLALALAAALAAPFTAMAAEGAEADPATGSAAADDAFELGRLTVYGERPEPIAVGDDTISRDEMWTFDRLTLDDAVKLTPGVMVS